MRKHSSNQDKSFFFPDIRFIFANFIKQDRLLEELKPSNIGFAGLSQGTHRFSYEIGDDFFACFEQSEIVRGRISLDLIMEKESDMLVIDYVFKGWVELDCDICLKPYRQPVEDEHRMYVKFGDGFTEQSEDVVVIPFETGHFDISHYVYEYIHLDLPIKRAHSGDGQEDSGCDKEMLDKVARHSVDLKTGNTVESLAASSQEALKKLRFDKNN